jgi:hypothetical protein
VQILSQAKRQKPPRTALQQTLKDVAGTLSLVALSASLVGALLGFLHGSSWQVRKQVFTLPRACPFSKGGGALAAMPC